MLMHAADEATVGLLKWWKGSLGGTGSDGETAGPSGMTGKGKAVQWAIPLFGDIGATDEKGRTVLHRRVEAGDLEEVLSLLERGANVHAKDKKGLTELHLAVDNGHTGTVIAPLANGANVGMPEKNGWTTMHFAAQNRHTETVIALLTNGAMVEAKVDDTQRALHMAVQSNKLAVVEIFLNHGARIESLPFNPNAPQHEKYSSPSIPANWIPPLVSISAA